MNETFSVDKLTAPINKTMFKISLCLVIFKVQLNMKIYAKKLGSSQKEIGNCEANQQQSTKNQQV